MAREAQWMTAVGSNRATVWCREVGGRGGVTGEEA
jgi:hypothetical protein